MSGRPTHRWFPASPCDTGCQAEDIPRSAPGVRPARLLAAGTVLAAALALLPVLRGPARARTLRALLGALLTALGVRVVVRGPQRFAPPGVGMLVVSNHVSWLDVVALQCVQPIRLVAKAEVSRWILVGPLADAVGCVYVDRHRLSQLPDVVAEVAAVLRGGSAMGVFVEGTTWCGRAVGGFRPAMFQAAIDAGVAVRPVALRYRLADGTPTTVAAFVGEQTLWRSLVTVAGVRGLVVQVHLLPPLVPVGADRRALAARAAARVARSGTDRRRPGAGCSAAGYPGGLLVHP